MQTIVLTSPKPSSPLKMAYSIDEACEALSLGRTTVYSLIKLGRLHVVRIGNRTLVPVDALRSLLETAGA